MIEGNYDLYYVYVFLFLESYNHILQLAWWTSLFEAIIRTTPLSEDRDELYDDNYQAEAEKFILERFRIFMNNKDVSNTK